MASRTHADTNLALCAAPGARLIRIRCSNQKSSWVLVGYARRSAMSWVGPWTLRSGGFVYAPKILPQCNGSRTGASEGFLFFQDKQRISARRRTDRVVRPRHLEMSVGLAPCETIFLSHSSSDSDQFWFARERNPPPDGQYIQAHFRLMLLRERYRRPLTFLASSRQSHDMSASMFVVCSGDPTSGARVVPQGCHIRIVSRASPLTASCRLESDIEPSTCSAPFPSPELEKNPALLSFD